MDSVLSSVAVRSMFLEVPAADFGDLALQLGCSLHRRRDGLVLSGERGGCALTFQVEGPTASLSHLAVHDDPDGRFVREVVVPLFLAYAGELHAALEWSPPREQPALVIKDGDAQHPMLAQPELPVGIDVSLALIEQWQHDARAAWSEYQRLKQPVDASA